jgi:hypothetical protein
MNDFEESSEDRMEHFGVLAEVDAQWKGFEEAFSEFEVWDAAWSESDEKRREVIKLERLLAGGDVPEGFVEGIKLSIGFFSRNQILQLERLTEHLGEGQAVEKDQEHFEKGSEKEGVDTFGERQIVLAGFDELMIKYYELVARLALSGREKEQIEALMKVAWTSIEACATAIKEAVRKGKSLTEIQLIVFRFEQQLNALDPDHGFVPSKI